MSAFLTIKLDALNKTYHSNELSILNFVKIIIITRKKACFHHQTNKRNEMFISFHVNVTSCGRQNDNRNENENGTINHIIYE